MAGTHDSLDPEGLSAFPAEADLPAAQRAIRRRREVTEAEGLGCFDAERAAALAPQVLVSAPPPAASSHLGYHQPEDNGLRFPVHADLEIRPPGAVVVARRSSRPSWLPAFAAAFAIGVVGASAWNYWPDVMNLPLQSQIDDAWQSVTNVSWRSILDIQGSPASLRLPARSTIAAWGSSLVDGARGLVLGQPEDVTPADLSTARVEVPRQQPLPPTVRQPAPPVVAPAPQIVARATPAPAAAGSVAPSPAAAGPVAPAPVAPRPAPPAPTGPAPTPTAPPAAAPGSATVTPAPAPASPPPAAAAPAIAEPAAPRPAERTPEPAREATLASARPAEEEAVRQTLQSYQTAYKNLDAAAAAAVWPSVDRRALSRAFATLKSQGLEFRRCAVTMTDANATVSCRGTLHVVPRVGNQIPHTAEQEWIFKMRRIGADWKIDDVSATQLGGRAGTQD